MGLKRWLREWLDIDEAKEHGQAMRHIISYLQALTSIYATEGSLAKAREEVEAL